MKTLILLLTLFSFTSVFAAGGEAEVVLIRGTAMYNNSLLQVGSKVTSEGVITVADKSYLKLRLLPSLSTIVIGANSSAKLNLEEGENKEKIYFLSGAFRWVTGKAFKKSGVILHSKNAVFGLRGTDFTATFNSALGETEVVCNEGEIMFTNLDDPKNFRYVKTAQWGGLGGRFGEKVERILDLQQPVLDHFNAATPLD